MSRIWIIVSCTLIALAIAWGMGEIYKKRRKVLVDMSLSFRLLWSKGYAPWVRPKARKYTQRFWTEGLATADELHQSYGQGQDGDVIWLRLGSYRTKGDLLTFVHHVLPRIPYRFHLVTTDGDASVPGSFPNLENLLASPQLLSWHTQNRNVSHPRIKPLPIGLNLHMQPLLPRETFVSYLTDLRRAHPWSTRERRPLVDVISKSHPERQEVAKLVQNRDELDILATHVPYTELFALYAQHRYVVSVRGNGWDCHRTWEALMAGCVVLVRTCPLDELHRSTPGIHILSAWTELGTPTLTATLESKFGEWVAPPLEEYETAKWLGLPPL